MSNMSSIVLENRFKTSPYQVSVG